MQLWPRAPGGQSPLVGRVIAQSADATAEAAAVEFNTDVWKLAAARRFEIAQAGLGEITVS